MSLESLIHNLDKLIHLHRKNNDMWVDFFETAREKIAQDKAFGCEYLIMAWHGIGGYDDTKIFDNERDEEMRKQLHPKIYEMARDIKNAAH